MCEKCYLFKCAIENADIYRYNYKLIVGMSETLIKDDLFELYAGDCEIEDTLDLLYAETKYTISHYVKCKTCEQYYFFGACVRGAPVHKVVDDIKNEMYRIRNFEMCCGTYFG